MAEKKCYSANYVQRLKRERDDALMCLDASESEDAVGEILLNATNAEITRLEEALAAASKVIVEQAHDLSKLRSEMTVNDLIVTHTNAPTRARE